MLERARPDRGRLASPSAACRPLRAAALRLAFAGFTTLPTWAVAGCDAHVLGLPEVVAFTGCINEVSARSLIRVLDKHPDVPLVVKSSGGAVNAAIDVARVMQRHRTRLIVRGECLSSCANYWLPVASSVEVEEGGVILFHGDARTTFEHLVDPRTIDETARLGMAEVARQETELGRDVPKVEDLHAMQAMRVSSRPIQVVLRGRSMSCPGQMRQPLWVPTLARLQAMGYVDRVVPRYNALAPGISSEPDIDPMFRASEDQDPVADCTVVSAR